jgi:hypothetical protein
MVTKNTTENKKEIEKREYYILAGERGIMRLLKEKDINLTPAYFMVIKENSKIGRLIKREANKRLKNHGRK